MKTLFHAPGLLLLALCGIICDMLNWDAGACWCITQYVKLRDHSLSK